MNHGKTTLSASVSHFLEQIAIQRVSNGTFGVGRIEPALSRLSRAWTLYPQHPCKQTLPATSSAIGCFAPCIAKVAVFSLHK
jgi:hypothetical protein